MGRRLIVVGNDKTRRRFGRHAWTDSGRGEEEERLVYSTSRTSRGGKERSLFSPFRLS